MIIVVGHRGAAGLEPENTLRSIKRAIDLGVDQVEVDARIAKDRRLVVIHDETVDRTTDGHGYVKDFTLSELRRLDAGKGEYVPTLEEVLRFTQGKVILQIELKVKEVTEPTVHLIESLEAEKDVLITSFMHELLEKVHKLNPNLKTGALFSDVQGDVCQRSLDVHSEAIHVHYRNVNARLVQEAHRRGLKVAVWNPDDEEEMKRMMNLGVDSVGTNRPDILLNL